MEIPAALISQLSQAGVLAVEQAIRRSSVAPRDLLDLDGLTGWDRILLLARPEILGTDGLHGFIDRVVGTGPCCADCAGKDTPAKRRQARSALNLLRRHLRRDLTSMDENRVAAAVETLRPLLDP
jgi:hypothetical protein